MLKHHTTNSNEKVYTKHFDGAKANEINHHILTTLHNDCPSWIIIHAETKMTYMRMHKQLMWWKELLILV